MALDDPLVTRGDLATWARADIEPDDAWAKTCIRAASALVRETAQQAEWTLADAPVMAKIIAAQCAMRAYVNPPEGEVSTTIGPLGSRLLDAVAEGFYLTDAETERLSGYAPESTKTAGSRTWVASLASTDEPPVAAEVLVYGVQPGADPVILGQTEADAVVYGLRPPVTYLPGEAPGVVRVAYRRRVGRGS